jgi:hypothetical protein
MKNLKRVNITIDEKAHKRIQKEGINLSALVREKLEDKFSKHTITLSVDKEVSDLYDRIHQELQVTDKDLSKYLTPALVKFLRDKILDLEELIELNEK